MHSRCSLHIDKKECYADIFQKIPFLLIIKMLNKEGELLKFQCCVFYKSQHEERAWVFSIIVSQVPKSQGLSTQCAVNDELKELFF